MSFKKYNYRKRSEAEMLRDSQVFYTEMNSRRSIRLFSDKVVDRAVLINCIRAAATAPSGANKQPFTFCLVENNEIRAEIRALAEAEERRNYSDRMNDTWLKDLEPIGTDWRKPFIEEAPFLVVLFKQSYGLSETGEKVQHYYVNESVGIAAGMFITALHLAGLATVTHTPSPMNFLEKVLNRPPNERAYLVLPVGIPHDNAEVPDIRRKPLEEVLSTY